MRRSSRPAGLEPGRVEQVADQPVEAVGLPDDRLDGLGVVDRAPLHQLGVALQRGDRVAQLVADQADELALGGASWCCWLTSRAEPM